MLFKVKKQKKHLIKTKKKHMGQTRALQWVLSQSKNFDLETGDGV